MAGEKTEKGTPRKKKESRKEGEVAKSKELISCFTLGGIILVFMIFGSGISNNIIETFRSYIANIATYDELSMTYVTENSYDAVIAVLKMGIPIMVGIMIIGIFANLVQVGIMFTPKAMKVKWSRVSPTQGFKRIFSPKLIVEMFKTILKMVIIGIIAYFSLKEIINDSSTFIVLNINDSLSKTFNIILSLGFNILIGIIAIAIADYIFQWFEYEKKMKMSKQDIKEEVKKAEGDPLVKSQIKNKQNKIARMRMMQEVPKADVIITNPTHFAIAIKYDISENSAPKVIAKGKDLIAKKIIEIAKNNNITVVENRETARALYKTTEIGQEIPRDLFKIVAEILAYVYSIKNKM